MCLLAIETTTSVGSFAVLKDEKIVFQDFSDIKITHSETIMVRIDNALKTLKIEKTDLKGICVSNGPGSFTGLRIGLATAKGIATGLKIPLIAFNTLEILAANVFTAKSQILALLDARVNEAYVAIFDQNLNVIKESHCRPYETITDGLKGEYICVGDVHLLEKYIPPPPAPPINVGGMPPPTFMESNIPPTFMGGAGGGNEYNLIKALPHQNMLLAASQFSLLKHKGLKFEYNEEYISNLEPYYIRKVSRG